MCKFNPKNDGRRIDPCMKIFLRVIESVIDKKKYKIVASCCGHKKYPMTIIVRIKNKEGFYYVELIRGILIPRKKKFYKKDKQGYYYIPEVKFV